MQLTVGRPLPRSFPKIWMNLFQNYSSLPKFQASNMGFWGFGVLDRVGFVYWNFLAWVVLRYCENIDGIHFQFLSFQSKANVLS